MVSRGPYRLIISSQSLLGLCGFYLSGLTCANSGLLMWCPTDQPVLLCIPLEARHSQLRARCRDGGRVVESRRDDLYSAGSAVDSHHHGLAALACACQETSWTPAPITHKQVCAKATLPGRLNLTYTRDKHKLDGHLHKHTFKQARCTRHLNLNEFISVKLHRDNICSQLLSDSQLSHLWRLTSSTVNYF